MTRFLILHALVLSLGVPSLAQNAQPYYFYKPLPYGSQATFNPLNVVINGSYGILQIPSNGAPFDRKIFQYPYHEWTKNMWLTAGHPIRTLDEFGWWRFATTEVIPTTLSMNKNQWVPNYFLHLMGAGMDSRKTEEWFRYQGYSHPRLWSEATMTAYHVLTEVIETRNDTSVTSDHLADLGIFDPLSMLIWTNDGVCRFFSEKLQLNEWSMQPAYNFETHNLENMGQFYVVKYPVSGDSIWYAMIHIGLHGTAGLTHRWTDGKALSLTGGFMVENLVPAGGGGLKAVLTWRAGAFYDRNNSLLCSLMLSGIPEERVQVNIYPGLLCKGPLSPGFFVSGTKEWIAGINLSYVPLGGAWGH